MEHNYLKGTDYLSQTLIFKALYLSNLFASSDSQKFEISKIFLMGPFTYCIGILVLLFKDIYDRRKSRF